MAKKPQTTKAPSVEFKPTVRFEPVVLPSGKAGEFLVLAGKPIVSQGQDELTTAQFAKDSGLSQDYVGRLCDQGKLKFRRRSPHPRSMYLIPRSELERIKNLTE